MMITNKDLRNSFNLKIAIQQCRKEYFLMYFMRVGFFMIVKSDNNYVSMENYRLFSVVGIHVNTLNNVLEN